MARIASTLSLARAAAACLLVFAVPACDGDGSRSDPPALYIDPPSALQGDSFVVEMTADGVAFDACDGLDASAVTFASAAGESEISVYSATAGPPESLLVHIAVDPGAMVGTHRAFVGCDASTVLEGVFEVRRRTIDPTLTVTPSEAAAGTADLGLDIEATAGASFEEGSSHVVFGDGDDISVSEQIVTGPQNMWVRVDISPGADIGDTDVAVITGADIVKGQFSVTELIWPTIRAEPDEVWRPAQGAPSTQATIHIEGSGVAFVEPVEDPDAGPGSEGTIVSFPGSPGIEVASTSIASSTDLWANIIVGPSAGLGTRPLAVATGSQVARIGFTVLPAPGDPALALTPSTLPRGVESALLLAEVTGAPLEEPLGAAFEETGCHVRSFEPLSTDTMAVVIDVDPDYPLESDVLQITTGATTVSACVSISDDLGSFVGTPTPESLEQGVTGWVVLAIHGDSFEPDAYAEVTARSGLRILSQSPSVDGGTMTLLVRVAPDAPTGPAKVTVTNGEDAIETFLTVEASNAVPRVDVSPEVVAPGRRDVLFDVSAGGFDLVYGETEIRFDDPAMEIVDFLIEDPGNALLAVDVGPGARSGATILYVDSPDGKAARSIRGVEAIASTANVSPSSVARGAAEEVAITVWAAGISFDEDTVAQVIDDAGLEVVRVTPLGDQQAEVEIAVDAVGPGGWIGLTLTTGSGRRVAVPLHVLGLDESLTLQIEPAEVTPAGGGIAVRATALEHGNMDPATTSVASGSASVRATLVEVVSETEVDLLVDVPYGFSPPAGGVPILALCAKGALVGFLDATALPSSMLAPGEQWQETLSEGETHVISADPGSCPTMALASEQNPHETDLRVSLVTSDGLAVQEVDERGRLWLVEEQPSLLTVRPEGTASGDPSVLRFVQVGAAASDLSEPDDEQDLATVLSADPCVEPFLGLGEIGGGLDVDRIEVPSVGCELVALCLARSLADRPWSTPDLAIELRDPDDEVVEESSGWPTGFDPDPRMLVPAGEEGRQLVIRAEVGTSGTYLVNVRGGFVIREVSREEGASFIEIETPPGADLSPFGLELLAPANGNVVETLALSGIQSPGDGVLVIAAAPIAGADAVHDVAALPDDEAFAVRLVSGGEIVDAVQVGGGEMYGEGDPIPNSSAVCFERPAGIDTDDNLLDFAGAWMPTPGS